MSRAAIRPYDPVLGAAERRALARALERRELASNAGVNRRVIERLRRRLGTPGVLLTTSCTAALELAFKALRLKPGDEVILPSFAYVSDATAVLAAGGRVVFADVDPATLDLDPRDVARRIGPRTRAILLLHYGGVACDLAAFRRLARLHRLALVEDAALALGSTWRGQPLGSLGDLGCFSFHATKPVTCGKGGALVTRHRSWLRRLEVMAAKGTDRSAFLRGEKDRYTWRDEGSSYLLPGLLAALLEVQLGRAAGIHAALRRNWQAYQRALLPLQREGRVHLAVIPAYAGGAFSVAWLRLAAGGRSGRDRVLAGLRRRGIPASSHYEPLHLSPFGRKLLATYPARLRPGGLPHTEAAGQSLLRLPLHSGLSLPQVAWIGAELAALLGSQRP